MNGFSLPKTQTDNTAAFFDPASATHWLARQPLANAPAMLAELVSQIEAFNTFLTPPRDRFKTMEVLRKTLFAVSGDCQRRYEGKPLPLLPAEQATIDLTRRLWRACAITYLHCLRACLDQDSSIVNDGARVAHRVLSCLRKEQMTDYLAGADPEAGFWSLLHSVWAAAEQLGVAHEPVADRLLGETSESTIGGQYGMALMLHLASPFSLTRGQFGATVRWLARWREQTKVLAVPDDNPKSCCIPLDLTQDRPIHDPRCAARASRWLAVGSVLRKMRQRLELLASGETPENLKLGGGLSSEACVSLLNVLSDRLKTPYCPVSQAPADISLAVVAVGLENSHRLLGGKGLHDPLATSSFGSKLSADQIAVFGHVVRNTEVDIKTETWRVARQEPGELHFLRPVAGVEARLSLRGLLALQVPQHEHYALAIIGSLYVPADQGAHAEGVLCVTASLLPGEPVPLIAEMREKPTGKVSRHPAFLLPACGGQPSSLVLPAGLPARALSIRFYEAIEQTALDLQLSALIERGGDNERWSCASA